MNAPSTISSTLAFAVLTLSCEAACARALSAGARSYRHVDSILKHGLDRQPSQEPSAAGEPRQLLLHENVRGGRYYH
jgi:hypothetical protein